MSSDLLLPAQHCHDDDQEDKDDKSENDNNEYHQQDLLRREFTPDSRFNALKKSIF